MDHSQITVLLSISFAMLLIVLSIVRSEINDETFKKCLVEKIKSWNFPSPPLGMDKYVEHKFRFMDKEGGE